MVGNFRHRLVWSICYTVLYWFSVSCEPLQICRSLGSFRHCWTFSLNGSKSSLPVTEQDMQATASGHRHPGVKCENEFIALASGGTFPSENVFFLKMKMMKIDKICNKENESRKS